MVARIDLHMDACEFNALTLDEFDSLVNHLQQRRRRYVDTPAALICATLANTAGKSAPEGTIFDLEDYLLMSEEEAEELSFRRRDERIRAQLAGFAATHQTVEG